jgi:phage antirepressor YoqD-like protein
MSDLALSNLSFFEYGSRQVRTATIDGSIYFGLSDVLRVMKSSTTTTAAVAMISEGMGDGYVKSIIIPDAIGRAQETLFLSEGALTFLLGRSRTEAGKGLNRLIHTQILPTIRATGKYEVQPSPPALPAMPKVPTTFREAMLLAIDLDDARAALQAKIDGDADRVGFALAIEKAEDNILIGTLAKTLGDIGPNILMGLLRGNNILMTSTNPAQHNIPYQRFISAGYFVVDENTIQVGNKTRLTFTTKVTPKGQIWLTKKYYEWQSIAA